MSLITIISITALASLVSLLVRKRVWMLETLAIIAGSAELAASLSIVTDVLRDKGYSYRSWLYADELSLLFLLVIAIVGLAASVYSVGYLRAEAKKGIIGFRRIKQYYVLLQLFLTAMYLAVLANSPIIMWMAIEATTLSTAFLISFYNKPAAMEAAWKYLIINSIGLLLGFWGTLLFLTGTAGSAGLVGWDMLMAGASKYNPALVKTAFVFVLIGYGTKMGLAPMHTWLPDAHSKAPIPISSLLSAVLLNIAFFAILRFKTITDQVAGPEFAHILLMAFGIVSVVIAALIIFVQRNYKRLLAYSSIEHMGIIALGFGFGGIGVFAALLQIIYHALAKTILFLSSGNMFLRYSSTKIKNVKGVLKVLPLTGLLFGIGVLAITGIPPFGTFVSEVSILSAGIRNHPVVTVILLFSLIIIFAGFLKHASAMLFGEPSKEMPRGEGSYWTTVPIVALSLLLIILGFYLPEPLRQLLNAVALKY